MGFFGHGVDVLSVLRVRRVFEDRPAARWKRVFHDAEVEYAGTRVSGMWESLAGRFAAKEAVFKALSMQTAFCPSEIEILPNRDVRLYGTTQARWIELGRPRIYLSLSHAEHMVFASAIVTEAS